jgi:phosphate-selective porin OprO and OprP
MKRRSLARVLVALSSSIAAAEPAPEATPPPTPVEPATAPEPTEPVGAAFEPPMAEPEVVEAKPDDKPALAVTYDGGTKLATDDGKFQLKLLFRNQLRFESNRSFDEETAMRHNQFRSAFYIPRSRFQVEGHIFGKDNRYKMELGLGDQGSFSFLKDMYVDKRLGVSPTYLRFGQWKRPFNRAEIVSDFGSTFNERSIQNELAGGGRSLGVAVHNDYERAPVGLEWVVGVFNTFNGTGDRPEITTTCMQDMTGAITCTSSRPSTVPADFGPTVVARVGWNSEQSRGYSESDLEGGPLRYGVGASYKVDLANLTKGMRDSWADNTSHGLEVDANIKVDGFSVTGGAVMMKIKDAHPEYGFYLQPALFVVPKHVEIGGRFALVTLTLPGAMPIERSQVEARAAVNYYMQGHTFKLASDGGFVMLTGDEPARDKPDMQVRVMLQLSL